MVSATLTGEELAAQQTEYEIEFTVMEVDENPVAHSQLNPFLLLI